MRLMQGEMGLNWGLCRVIYGIIRAMVPSALRRNGQENGHHCLV